MQKLKFFDSIAAAELAKNMLKELGIESYVRRRGIEFAGDMGDSYGADLFVAEENIEKARKTLNIDAK